MPRTTPQRRSSGSGTPRGRLGIEPEDSDRALSRALLAWYASQRRDLPWRASRDPYAVWVSELMLQQTQVQTVLPYFARWMAAFPSIQALAQASEEQVLRIWQGLGYYSRARRLHAGARHVTEALGGELPASVEALRALPGVGPYTAGAIASIAFGLDEPTVDGNVARVLSRLFTVGGDLQRGPQKEQLWSLARRVLPPGQAGDFNQALMELGALVCTPKKPLCLQCPVQKQCQAYAAGDVARYPQATVRPKLTSVQTVAALALQHGRVLVAQLPSDAPRWGGLWVFPQVECGPNEAPLQAAARAVYECTQLQAEPTRVITRLTHHITRYKIDLSLVSCERVRGTLRVQDGHVGARWLRLDALDELAMPAPHRKLVRALQKAAPGESLDD